MAGCSFSFKRKKLGRPQRISRIVALAIHLDELIRTGQINTPSEIASLSGITRARVTQIQNLSLLAPDIQEELLFLPNVVRGKDPIKESQLRDIAVMRDWQEQRKAWALLKDEVMPRDTTRSLFR